MTTTGKSSFRRSTGRYDREIKAHGADNRARPKPNLNIRTAIVRVDDPYAPADKIVATVNRRVDILEAERSRGWISEGAYRVGRTIQRAYELGGRSTTDYTGAGGGDPVTARETAMIGQLERAEERVALTRALTKAIGEEGARHLHKILGERWSYRDVAHREGLTGERGVTQVAYRFRGLLEDVTRNWSSKGRAA